MIKKLLFITFILLNVKVSVAESSNVTPLTIANFRIESSTPNRIYFDSSESITASTITGFDLKDHGGIVITAITINSGQLNGHYFTVSSGFKWYHNNTFNYNGGSDLENGGGVGLNRFDLQYIKNNIPVPDSSGTEYYVDASVSSSGNGLTESEAFKTIQEGINVAGAGDKIWIKTGVYNENVATARSGTESAPIFIEGYKSNIGDITSLYYTYGDGNFDANEMPLLSGGDRNTGIAISFSKNNSFVILKNIQITNYQMGIYYNKNNQGNIFERVILKDFGNSTGAGNGEGFNFSTFADNSDYNRLIDCIVINASHQNIVIDGNNNLFENVKSYCDESLGFGDVALTTDYYYNIEGNFNIVRNSLADKHINQGHNGHGFTFKGTCEYNLVEFCESINIQNSYGARHSTCKFNIFRDSEAHANVPYRKQGGEYTAGISIIADASFNTFDRMYIHDVANGFYLNENTEDRASVGIGHNNIFKNIIVSNISESGMRIRNSENTTAPFNDNKFYNITWNNVTTLFKIYSIYGGISLNGNEFKNNIFKNTANLNHNFSGYTPVSGFIWDYNNFFNSFPAKGSNVLGVDPKFINSSSGNFKLQEDSECIDSGISLDNVVLDFDGKPRPRGSESDIGAFEDQSDVVSAGSDVTICNGSSTTLTASGVGDFSWDTGETTQSITVSPSTTTTYSVTVTDGNSTTTDSVIVTVNESPVADAGSDVSICDGTETILIASGGDTYLWSTGETTESITVSPNENTTYSVTTSNDGCTTTAIDEVIVTVNSVPNLDAGNDIEICVGESITLTASGADNYLWNTGETTASISISPSIETTYTVTSTSDDCSISDDVIVSVDNPPTVNLGEDVTICSGDSITLTAEGNGDFLWSTGDTTSSITVSPSTTTTYSVTASSSCDTTGITDEIIINVTPDITLDAGPDITICQGENIILTASGNNDFLWNTGETTASITVTPATTTTYSVTSSSGNCSLTDEVVVTVDNPPSVSLGADVTICSGDSIILTAEGIGDFLWSTGETTSSITVNPSTTTAYSVTANSSCDTTGITDEIIINVTPEIILDAGSDITICQGENATLTASGNNDFLWIATGETTASITVNPTTTTTYIVMSSSGNCSLSDQVVVTVVDSPSVSLGADVSICEGNNITLTAEGSGNFVWSTGETTSSITVNPSSTTTYSVTASGSCNTTGVSDEIVVIVNSIPNIDAGPNVTIDIGSSTILTATGEGNFLWSTGETTSSINVSPSTTTTYTVKATLNGACSSEDSVVVTVNDSSQQVVANAGDDIERCMNSPSIILTASGGENYLWNTGEITASITVNPTETTIYTVTVSNSISIDSDEVTVFVDQECSGISNRIFEKEIMIYPNPTEGQLNIELNGFNDELNISLFSLNGSLVYSENITNNSPDKILKKQIDLSRLGRGVYFVRITNKDDIRTKKILVI